MSVAVILPVILHPNWAEQMTAYSTLALAVAGAEDGTRSVSVDPTVLEKIQSVIDDLEIVAYGCATNIYDPEVVYSIARSFLRQVHRMTRSYVLMLRNGRFDTRPAQPSAYEYLEELCASIEARVTKEARGAKAPAIVTDLAAGRSQRGRRTAT